MATYIAHITSLTNVYLTPSKVMQLIQEEQIESLDSVVAMNQITNRCITELRPVIDQDLKNKNFTFTSRNFLVHLLDIVPRRLREVISESGRVARLLV